VVLVLFLGAMEVAIRQNLTKEIWRTLAKIWRNNGQEKRNGSKKKDFHKERRSIRARKGVNLE